MKNILLLVLLIFNYSRQSPPVKQNRIIGGHNAHRNQFPFFAQLYVIFQEQYEQPSSCGATLIHKRWILSAAHCLSGVTEGWVNMGILQVNETHGNINKLKTAHVHPDYVLNTTSDGTVRECRHDVAVGKLEREYRLSASIQTVHLPNKAPRCKRGTVVGAGQKRFYPDDVSEFLKFAEVYSKKRKELGNPTLIPASKTLFFSEVSLQHQGYIYRGDSGGPYLCTKRGVVVQYGIISQTDNDTHRNTVQSAYESVYKHMDFILKYVPNVKIYGKTVNKQRSRATKSSATVVRTTSTLFVGSLVVLSKLVPM